MNENLFLYAAKKKLRWTTPRGELSVEQLFETPLRPKPGDQGFNLDALYKATNKALKEMSEESLIETKRTPAHTQMEARVEILKTIVGIKLEAEKKAETRAANAVQAARITEILAEKKDAKLSEKSETELKKLLAQHTAVDDEE